MSEWGIVTIIVLCILVNIVIQMMLCYTVIYAGNRSVADDTNIELSQRSVIHNYNEGSPCESPSLSDEHSSN